jgi:hypothetical protein
MNRWYPRIRYKSFWPMHPGVRGQAGLNARRYFADSYFYHREHTVAVVKWEWPSTGTTAPYGTQGTAPVPVPQNNAQGAPQPWSTPDLTAIVAEIVGRPGFQDGNRLAIVLGFDGCWNDLNSATLATYMSPTLGADGQTYGFKFLGAYEFVNRGTCQPTLDVTNPELRLTVGP